MKSLVLLVAMSLMLIGAAVVVAIPSQAEAAGAQWCGAAGCSRAKANVRGKALATVLKRNCGYLRIR
jgi:hypothetical protein